MNKIIDSFEKKPRRPTYRIGLELEYLEDDHYVVGPSDFILQKILPINTLQKNDQLDFSGFRTPL